jgi:adenine-specific DNA methylase
MTHNIAILKEIKDHVANMMQKHETAGYDVGDLLFLCLHSYFDVIRKYQKVYKKKHQIGWTYY